MHKMLKVSDFKNERLLRCFFALKSFAIALVMIGILSAITVSADSDGSLTINTDILTNNQVQAGGVGDFPIRGELFSSALTEFSKQNSFKQNERIEQAKTIDFSIKSRDVSDDKQVKQLLFENYRPQVITTKNQENTKQSDYLFLIATLTMLFLGVVGIFAGRWRIKQKLKKQRTRK
ncbi:type VII secretion protein EssA [Pseudolactococcus yaeyamensis]